jgi:hypothetical protein
LPLLARFGTIIIDLRLVSWLLGRGGLAQTGERPVAAGITSYW